LSFVKDPGPRCRTIHGPSIRRKAEEATTTARPSLSERTIVAWLSAPVANCGIAVLIAVG
jgi:hypothetical protein